ncbi:hypothetical protein FA95DRAFT_1592437 [Auriscalpium vulgare]|uniref:Uncharacterized protein n=1 Tax=Auriscalpium vulgare TaxID=40419 RepID=A0ACB8S9J5_9AGAM|nr:hypothetical protein FA95DRAFT_1592437 [Auriscalpium vulgare]
MASLSSASSAPVSVRSTDWGRSGERGSAFRGMSKTRGGGVGGAGTGAGAGAGAGGGGSGGRGGRGGRGGGRGGGGTRGGRTGGPSPTPEGRVKPTSNPVPAVVPTGSARSSVSAKSSASTVSQALPNADLPPRPKGPSRRGSQQQPPRKVPSLNVEPASPMVDSFAAAQGNAARPVARRRRSHQSNKLGPVVTSGETLSVDPPSVLRPRKSHSGPSSPRAPSKDAPPHLSAVSAGPATTTFSKENIDSLVERVRAMAMEHNRPATPGSHIDWAGDDDDTLPDLDDWGVPSSTTGTTSTHADASLSEPTVSKLELMSPILDDSLKQLPHDFDKPKIFAVPGESPNPPVTGNIVNGGDETPGSRDDKSLAGASTDAATPQQVTVNGAKRSPLPSSLPSKPVTTPAPPSITPPSPNLDHHTNSVHPSSLTDSIHAPKGVERSSDEQEQDRTGTGLSASMHAPKSSYSETSLCSLIPEQPAQSAPANFQPSHGRSRTLGRPPFSAGGAHAQRTFLSGASTPNSANVHHGRTQSTPPATAARHACANAGDRTAQEGGGCRSI